MKTNDTLFPVTRYWSGLLVPLLIVATSLACTPSEPITASVAQSEETGPCYCPCAKERDVRRDSRAAGDAPDAGTPEVNLPDECRLYHLAEQYSPVVFSHTNHVEYADNCATCHHHSSRVEVAPPCRECHGVTSGDLRLPGLKGAYHRQCMNCHREMGSGPLDCVGCHALADGAVKDATAMALESVGDNVLLGHLAQEFGGVNFKHRLHVDVTDSCSECHHQEKGYDKTPACRECHNTRDDLKHAYHEQCLACHQTTSAKKQSLMEDLTAQLSAARNAGKTDEIETLTKRIEGERERGSSPLGCKDCHLPKKAPASVDLGQVEQLFGTVKFNHTTHAETTTFCTDCHHTNKDHGLLEPCRACHPDKDHPGKPGVTKAQTAYHSQCIDCHRKEAKGPVECAKCHTLGEAPAKVAISLPGSTAEGTSFDHATHVDIAEGCLDCHHGPQSYDGIVKCGSCHTDGKDGKTQSLQDALHKQCIDCHKQDDQGPTGCEDCHAAREQKPAPEKSAK